MSQYISFEMTEKERQNSVIQTIINMLVSRRWLSPNFEEHFKTLVKSPTELIDSTHINGVKKVAIKFYNSKLNTLKNDREIDSFVFSYPDYHKILIVSEMSSKVEKQISDTKNFEIFKLMELVRDISKHHLVPKHILLPKTYADRMMSEYKLKKADMGRIYIDDPMARYLYAQKDDIIQIIRPSTSSCYATYYRLVILGSIYA